MYGFTTRRILVVHRRSKAQLSVLSFVLRFRHVGCKSQRFDCLLLVFIKGEFV